MCVLRGEKSVLGKGAKKEINVLGFFFISVLYKKGMDYMIFNTLLAEHWMSSFYQFLQYTSTLK